MREVTLLYLLTFLDPEDAEAGYVVEVSDHLTGNQSALMAGEVLWVSPAMYESMLDEDTFSTFARVLRVSIDWSACMEKIRIPKRWEVVHSGKVEQGDLVLSKDREWVAANEEVGKPIDEAPLTIRHEDFLCGV